MKDDISSLLFGGCNGDELSGCGSSRRSKSRKTRKSSRMSGIRGGKDNLTKADLAKYAAEQCGISQQKAKCVIDSTCEFIKKMLHGDNDACVTIAKFGTFRTRSGKYDLNGKRGTYTKLTFKASK